jgi:flagellar hook-associated protein 1 FlgK
MYGINVGLEIGRRALLAQQYSLNTTGHNIANVNTPGFTRQQVMMVTTLPFSRPDGNLGTGVKVETVRRIRSYFLDDQYRQESQRLARWQTLSQSWGQVENIFIEPSDTGFSALLDEFWNSWQDLANNPDSTAARSSVREQAKLLVNSFHHFHNQLVEFQTSLDDDIQKCVDYINNVGHQLAALNEEIATAELTGQPANDLRDRRDLLIDELSEYINVDIMEQPSGTYTVLLGGMALVDGTSVLELTTDINTEGSATVHNVMFATSTAKPEIVNGKLAGFIEARDEIVAVRLEELDELALAFVQKINAVHSEGYTINGVTGVNFFDSNTTGAQDIELDELILNDERYIAVSTNGELGDNSNALRITALRHELFLKNGTSTFGDYYSAMVGTIGIRSKEAQNMAENQEALVFHISDNRQALEGVSLDEELTNMIKYEHAYAAAARVITAMDEALYTVIHNMGAAGG